MYRVITFKSKELKKKTVFLAADNSAADFDNENIQNTKKKKKKKEIVTYIIDGVEVREEDLTEDERLDIASNNLLNTDGFYTPLKPEDYTEKANDSEEYTETSKKDNTALKIAAVLAVAVALMAGLAFIALRIL